MSEIIPQRILARVVHATRAGEDPRQTGAFHLDLPGPATSGEYVQDVEVRYTVETTDYRDLLSAFAPCYVWQISTDPAVTDLALTQSTKQLTFDTQTKRWFLFSIAAKAASGVGAGTPFVVEERHWDRVVGELDVLKLEYLSTPGTVRHPTTGCNACGPTIGALPLRLIAGYPDLGSPLGLVPPLDEDHFVPLPGYDDADGDPLTAKLAGPTGVVKGPDGSLYIGCGGYSSDPSGHGFVQASGTVRRIRSGVIETLAGIGDTFPLGNPDSHVYPTTGDPHAAQLGGVGGILVDPTSGDLTLFGLHTLAPGLLNALENPSTGYDPCYVHLDDPQLAGAGGRSHLGTLSNPDGPAPVLARLSRTWTKASAGDPWVDVRTGAAATFGLFGGNYLARTSAGDLYADSVMALTFETITGGDVDTQVFTTQWSIARLDNATTTVLGEIAWNAVGNQAGGAGHCQADLLFPIKGPQQLWLDQDRYLYVACSGNHQIRMYDLQEHTFTLVVGDVNEHHGYQGDGQSIYTDPTTIEPGKQITLNGPGGVCIDSAGNLIIADTGNACIRRVARGSGVITTIAGVGGQPGFSQWQAAVTDAGGAVITPAGPVPDTQLVLGPALKTQLLAPMFVAPGAGCGVYIVDKARQQVLFVGCPAST